MKFVGLQKTSLADFPNKVASVLFTPGCNLRCPFCHNWRIVVDPRPPFLTEEAAFKILEDRKKYVDSVVITGGEPTIHKDIPKFLKKLQEKGFTVKLDTNGLNSKTLKQCLPHLSYVALDVKTSPEKYGNLGAENADELMQTIDILKTEKVDYEFRTTVVPGLVQTADMHRICEIVKGVKNFALQQFVPGDTLDESLKLLKPYSREIIMDYAKIMRTNAENVILRI
ncbi:MAG TPA: anaerobic ribonucleoside-triphosphate reductase activating protein [Candidatus Acidoferrum sp.]|nr:anaerobic ribonucleoside-triphosphate reductase activating protein [Candidatus Acidoferrum sp.]